MKLEGIKLLKCMKDMIMVVTLDGEGFAKKKKLEELQGCKPKRERDFSPAF